MLKLMAILCILSSPEIFCHAEKSYSAIIQVSSVNSSTRNGLVAELSGIYISGVPNFDGILVYIESSNSADHTGCSQYANKLNEAFIALIELGGCTIRDKINMAIKNNATGLLIRSKAIFENSHLIYPPLPLVTLMISQSDGKKLIEIAKQNSSNYFLSIVLNDKARKMFKMKSERNELTTSAVVSLSLGLFSFAFIVFLMFTVFYSMQRSRQVDNYEKFDKLVNELTKKAINKMEIAKTDQILNCDQVCVICLDCFDVSEDVRKLPCQHYFHNSCINKWLYENPSCPVCKVDIIKAYKLDAVPTSTCIRRFLEYLNLVERRQSLMSLMKILGRESYRTHGVVDEDRTAAYSVASRSVSIDMEAQQTELVKQFQRIHLQTYAVDQFESDDDNNNNNKDIDNKRRLKKMNFFGVNV